MYHAPIETDQGRTEDQSPPEGALLEPAFLPAGAAQAPAAHLAQREMSAFFASFLAFSNVGGALLVGFVLLPHVEAALIGAWILGVAVVNWLLCRRDLRSPNLARSNNSGNRMAVATTIVRAALWAGLPAYVFGEQPPGVQAALAGAMLLMMMGGVALTAVPAAAVAWIGTLLAAVATSFLTHRAIPDVPALLAFAGLATAICYFVARLSFWTERQLALSLALNADAKAVRSLLLEYERRGIGWLWQVDSSNRILYVSERLATLIGRPSAQLAGASLPAALGGSGNLGRALLSQEPFADLELQVRTRSGTRSISLTGGPTTDATGAFAGFSGVGVDVTEARKAQDRLVEMASLDVLTGLPNRGRIREILGEALPGSASPLQTTCAILFLDLDGFKPVNDRFGHLRGDEVLRQVAQRLVSEAGSSGRVGRMGGDEFAIVIPEAGSAEIAEKLARRVIDAIAAPFRIGQQDVKIGVSIGCAFGPEHGANVEELIQKADLALYQAKAKGKGCWCIFDSAMQDKADSRLRLEQDLRAAIGSKQFRLVYQPLISAATQTLMGFEALIRWHHPQRGVVSPAEFVPIAEESGLIVPLGDWVIEEACRSMSQWRSDVSVAVNVSPRQLLASSLVGKIKESLSRYRIPADRLELEVTESMFVGDGGGALDMLKRLRALGVGIALDDFGTGYSSLGYLNKAVFHKLKIDGSFIREAAKAENQETMAIIQSIVLLAKSFRMTVTAEGVETAEDFARMRDMGCHQIQGYLFGAPMSFEEATALVQQGNLALRG